MKNKKFTSTILLCVVMSGITLGVCAQNTGTGTGWNDNYQPSVDLILNEDFSHFEHFGNWQHENNSNSKPVTDEQTGVTTRGTCEGQKTIQFIESTTELTYTWDSCAFAPNWGVSASMSGDGIPVDPDPTTAGVSDGFVEIARDGFRTLAGEFIVDLSNIAYLEGIQYSHSSCGGKKRGFVLSLSIDAGETWDTIRYQSGNHVTSFTRDPFDWSTTPNDFTCEPSASGMLWEDALYLSKNEGDSFMLKFEACNDENPQAVRIHDLKIYGEIDTETLVKDFSSPIEIRIGQHAVYTSEKTAIEIYSIAGNLLATVENSNVISTRNLDHGLYLLMVKNGNRLITQKFIKH